VLRFAIDSEVRAYVGDSRMNSLFVVNDVVFLRRFSLALLCRISLSELVRFRYPYPVFHSRIDVGLNQAISMVISVMSVKCSILAIVHNLVSSSVSLQYLSLAGLCVIARKCVACERVSRARDCNGYQRSGAVLA